MMSNGTGPTSLAYLPFNFEDYDKFRKHCQKAMNGLTRLRVSKIKCL